MNTKDQLAKIEGLCDICKKYPENNCSKCRKLKSGFLLGTISQLKIRKEKIENRKEKIENKYHFPYHLDYEGTEEDKKDYEQITADLKYYENKLKDLEEKE
jgi:hypothetical protein